MRHPLLLRSSEPAAGTGSEGLCYLLADRRCQRPGSRETGLRQRTIYASELRDHVCRRHHHVRVWHGMRLLTCMFYIPTRSEASWINVAFPTSAQVPLLVYGIKYPECGILRRRFGSSGNSRNQTSTLRKSRVQEVRHVLSSRTLRLSPARLTEAFSCPRCCHCLSCSALATPDRQKRPGRTRKPLRLWSSHPLRTKRKAAAQACLRAIPSSKEPFRCPSDRQPCRVSRGLCIRLTWAFSFAAIAHVHVSRVSVLIRMLLCSFVLACK